MFETVLAVLLVRAALNVVFLPLRILRSFSGVALGHKSLVGTEGRPRDGIAEPRVL